MSLMLDDSQEVKIKNLESFCSYTLISGGHNYSFLNVNNIAQKFINYFSLQYPLSWKQLEAICKNSNIILDAATNTGKARGYNFSYGDKKIISYKQNDALCGQIYTVLHEMYEVVKYTFSVMGVSCDSKKANKKQMEINAEQFAARVFLPDNIVCSCINMSGFDVFELVKYGCSYSTAMMRFSDILYCIDNKSRQPISIINLLYERAYWKKHKRVPRLLLKVHRHNGFPFVLTRKRISKLLFYSPRKRRALTMGEIVKIFSNNDKRVLIKNFTLLYTNVSLKVDMLVCTVNWFHYEKTAKVLVHIVPSTSPYLRDLAIKKHYEIHDVEIIEDNQS